MQQDVPGRAEPPAPLLMVAGEASGDQHGAALVRALHERFPRLRVYGVGGGQMRAAGVETLFDIESLNVVGLVEACAKIPHGLRMACHLLGEARRRGTRVAVLIDAPGFNVPLAGWAKRAGLRVVYYVSPQVWAWRRGRVRKIARRVEKMLTLFPFEVPYYTAAGVAAEYVGHPLLDRVQELPPPEQAAAALGLDPHRPLVALLPGSRRHEVERLLPPMLEALQRLGEQLPQVQGVLPVAPTIARSMMAPYLVHTAVPIQVVEGQSLVALRAAHFAMVASGTATLEAGLIGTPMVVIYRVHPLTALLVRLLIRVPYIALVNIIAGRQLVPELVQRHVRPQTMAALALQSLTQAAEAQRMRSDLATLRTILGPGDGARRAAASVGAFLDLEGAVPGTPAPGGRG